MIIPKREKKDIKTTSVSSIAMKPMRHFVILSTSITSILPLRPTDVHSMRNRKAWWICKEGYEWQASPHNRMAGRGCPFCNQHKVIPDETSLAVVRPEIAAQWDYERNAPHDPCDVAAFSNKKI